MSRPLHTIKRRSPVTAWLLAGLLCVVPIGQHAAAGVLLCFGADGHVDVEDGRWSDCAPGTVADPQAPPLVANDGPNGDCGDCVDVPLLVNPVEGRGAIVKPAMPPLGLAYATAAAALVLPAGTLDPAPAPHRQPMARPALVGLRTVVLLV